MNNKERELMREKIEDQMRNSKYGVAYVDNSKQKKRFNPFTFVAYLCGQLIGIAIVCFITTVILAAMWNVWLWLT